MARPMEILKISPLDIHNQPLVRSKDLNDCVYDTLEWFWKTKEYNEIGWLLLISLEKDELQG